MLEYKKDYSKIIGIVLFAVPCFLALAHLIYFILTKIAIFIADRLFSVDWSNDFWPVYLAVFIVCGLLGSGIQFRRG